MMRPAGKHLSSADSLRLLTLLDSAPWAWLPNGHLILDAVEALCDAGLGDQVERILRFRRQREGVDDTGLPTTEEKITPVKPKHSPRAVECHCDLCGRRFAARVGTAKWCGDCRPLVESAKNKRSWERKKMGVKVCA